MSGTNPFRREEDPGIRGYDHSQTRAIDQSDTSSRREEAQLSPLNTDIPTTKSKTGKTVRIISPHSLSSEVDDFGGDGDLATVHNLTPPPPPPPPPPESTSPDDHKDDVSRDFFNAAPGDGKVATTKDGAGGNRLIGDAHGFSLNTTFPTNPFRKPLASIDNGDEAEARKVRTASNVQRPQFDVNEFKNMLLTGREPESNASSGPPNVTFKSPPYIGENTSNADTWSLSRRSLSDTFSAPLSDTPRTSQEILVSDEERQRLVDSTLRVSNKPKPATPIHRHGKSVKGNSPQTVSFEDPTLSFRATGMSPPTSPNLPVSKYPPSSDTAQLTGSDEARSIKTNITDTDSSDPKSIATICKKAAPAPPPSRRQGQARPQSLIQEPRKPSSRKDSERADTESETNSSLARNSRPAPPLPRRRASNRADSHCSLPTMTSLATSPDSIGRQLTSVPTPPSRSPSLRTSERQVANAPIPNSPSMPPPPPPRRRGSSQGSYTPSRLSGDYRQLVAHRSRGDSGSSSISQLHILQRSEVAEQPLEPDKPDPLADLTALQREVDEYRGKIGR